MRSVEKSPGFASRRYFSTVVLVLSALLTCAKPQMRSQPPVHAFVYRVSLVTQDLRDLPDETSSSLGRVPAGSLVAETGEEAWLEKNGANTWLNVAYRGDVGWLRLDQTETPERLGPYDWTHSLAGLWQDTQLCKGVPAYLSLNFDGSFLGMRCEFCDIGGCPLYFSGTWKQNEKGGCLREKEGTSGCFTVWKGLLVSLPTTGFFWEYHGGAALSGLAKR